MPRRQAGAAFLWSLGLTVVLLLLARLDRGALTGPALTEPKTWSAWLAARPPLDAAMALVRLGLVALSWYLLAVTTLQVAGAAIGLRPLVKFARVLMIPSLRGALGVAVLALPQLPLSHATADVPTATMHSLELTPAAPAVGARQWVVRPGDSFWRAALDVTAAQLGRQPTAGEVVPCWVTLVEANRHALIDPRNPNLIRPGQVFTLPSP